jgi:ribosomal protein L40E
MRYSVSRTETKREGGLAMADQPMKAHDEKFCSSCGAAINKLAEICPKCGVRQSSAGISGDVSQEDAQFLPKAASCCFPIIGLVLYFVWKDSKPKASKDVCTWAIVGFAVGTVAYLIAMALGAGAAFVGG